MATEHRWIGRYEEIPPEVSSAILAAEDQELFSGTAARWRFGVCFR
jgi:membrane peptidoglycan carboxypeptidase